jgi:hypothetical protein
MGTEGFFIVDSGFLLLKLDMVEELGSLATVVQQAVQELAASIFYFSRFNDYSRRKAERAKWIPVFSIWILPATHTSLSFFACRHKALFLCVLCQYVFQFPTQ